MRSTSVLCVVSVVGLLFAAGDARAQTPNYPPPASGTPTSPPPSSPPPSAPPPAVAPPSAAPAPAPAPYRGGEETEPKDEGRLRIGFNVNGGAGSGGNLSGPFFGGTFRVGWQLDHLMAIYGQASAFGWFGTTDKTLAGQSLDISAIGGYQFTPMFSLTPANIIELAAGPSLDRLSGGSSSTSVAGATVTQNVTAYSGFYFALHGRAALHIGGKPNTTTGRRVSFTIGFDIHPTFAEGNTITFYTVGLGADWY
jgi:hypothetical protein